MSNARRYRGRVLPCRAVFVSRAQSNLGSRPLPASRQRGRRGLRRWVVSGRSTAWPFSTSAFPSPSDRRSLRHRHDVWVRPQLGGQHLRGGFWSPLSTSRDCPTISSNRFMPVLTHSLTSGDHRRRIRRIRYSRGVRMVATGPQLPRLCTPVSMAAMLTALVEQLYTVFPSC